MCWSYRQLTVEDFNSIVPYRTYININIKKYINYILLIKFFMQIYILSNFFRAIGKRLRTKVSVKFF